MAASDIAVPQPAPSSREDWMWGIALAAAVAVFLLHITAAAALKPPEAFLPLATWLSQLTDWFVSHFRWIFRAITWGLSKPFALVRWIFDSLAWPTVMLIVIALCYAARGRGLALLGAAFCAFIVIAGYWPKTAVTLSLVAVAVPLSVAIGLAGGILMWRSRVARNVITPLLDLMQTIPTFAYLIPILALFGLGPVVGVIASAIYAIPPMVHGVALGLERVPPTIVEAAKMSGSSRRQMLWWVMLPSALRTILVGINQTVMASLSMVIIASMVGGVDDLGIEVYQSMKQAKFGESLLAGLVIAFVAILIDRTTRGFAEGAPDHGRLRNHRAYWLGVLAAAVAMQLAAQVVPWLARFPEEWQIHLAPLLNAGLQSFTVFAFPFTSWLKTFVVFVIMLPLKIGFSGSVRPAFWGFEITPSVIAVYTAIALTLTALAWRSGGMRLAFAVMVGAALYYSGTTGLAWPAMAALVLWLTFSLAGWRIAALAAFSLLFILATGSWTNAMISLQLCLIGVSLSFVAGSLIGVWAALDDRVSAMVSPICDTLQTMPIFVFLIPAVMIFLVGEFTALIAISLYAIVPSIRYTELGIRNVPLETIEATRIVGATRWQVLTHVQIPMAIPEIALGLNQTIMMALAMVIVAALVGAQGLGTDVMIGLSRADTGRGLVAGLAIALIAIVADRTLQAWASDKKKALGLG